MAQTDTKMKIIDTAERLFARDGFHMASLRTLTDQADVNLAAVNYHFGSKEGLLQAVIERRILPLNEIRAEKMTEVLDQATAAGQRPLAKRLLQAFIGPTLEFRNSGPGAKDFIAMVGRSLSEPDETVRNHFIPQVLPNFKILFRGLKKAIPELPENLLMARLQFTMGSMSHMMCSSSQLGQLFPDIPEPLNDKEMVTALIDYVSAGLEAPF